MIPADLNHLPQVIKDFLDYTATKAGVVEIPPGSNRGPDIDEWAKEFGSPLGSFWCALSVGHCRRKFGLWTPPRRELTGSCDEWFLAAERAGVFTPEPSPGCAVLYTNHRRLLAPPAPLRYAGRWDIVHIGTVLRATPVEMAWEGNTTLGKYDTNGFVQTLKQVERSRVLGYVLPFQPGTKSFLEARHAA